MADGILTPCNVARSWRWFRQVTAPYNVTCGSGIMTLSSPGGSTLQCGRWFWDDMPLNSPKHRILEFYTWFRFQPITAVDMSFCTSLWNMIQIEPPSAVKMTSCRFSRKQISAIVNRHHSSKLLSFPENPLFTFWHQDPTWRISAILDFRDPIMSPLKSPCTTCYEGLESDMSDSTVAHGQ